VRTPKSGVGLARSPGGGKRTTPAVRIEHASVANGERHDASAAGRKLTRLSSVGAGLVAHLPDLVAGLEQRDQDHALRQ